MIIKRKLFGGGFNINTYNGIVQNANSTPDGQRILEGYQKKYAKEINDYKSKTALSVVPKPSSTPKPNPTPTGKQPFVGIKQGALNTWNRMGKAGKAGTIAAGLGGAYLMGKGLFGGKKD